MPPRRPCLPPLLPGFGGAATSIPTVYSLSLSLSWSQQALAPRISKKQNPNRSECSDYQKKIHHTHTIRAQTRRIGRGGREKGWPFHAHTPPADVTPSPFLAHAPQTAGPLWRRFPTRTPRGLVAPASFLFSRRRCLPYIIILTHPLLLLLRLLLLGSGGDRPVCGCLWLGWAV